MSIESHAHKLTDYIGKNLPEAASMSNDQIRRMIQLSIQCAGYPDSAHRKVWDALMTDLDNRYRELHKQIVLS